MGGHSSVNIEFKQDYDLDELRDLLADEGIIVRPTIAQNLYPMAITANERRNLKWSPYARFSQPNSLSTCGGFRST